MEQADHAPWGITETPEATFAGKPKRGIKGHGKLSNRNERREGIKASEQ